MDGNKGGYVSDQDKRTYARAGREVHHPSKSISSQATTNYEFAGSLPTPIHVNRLEIASADHPQQGFCFQFIANL